MFIHLPKKICVCVHAQVYELKFCHYSIECYEDLKALLLHRDIFPQFVPSYAGCSTILPV